VEQFKKMAELKKVSLKDAGARSTETVTPLETQSTVAEKIIYSSSGDQAT
jgi:hypothetical protein